MAGSGFSAKLYNRRAHKTIRHNTPYEHPAPRKSKILTSPRFSRCSYTMLRFDKTRLTLIKCYQSLSILLHGSACVDTSLTGSCYKFEKMDASPLCCVTVQCILSRPLYMALWRIVMASFAVLSEEHFPMHSIFHLGPCCHGGVHGL